MQIKELSSRVFAHSFCITRYSLIIQIEGLSVLKDMLYLNCGLRVNEIFTRYSIYYAIKECSYHVLVCYIFMSIYYKTREY